MNIKYAGADKCQPQSVFARLGLALATLAALLFVTVGCAGEDESAASEGAEAPLPDSLRFGGAWTSTWNSQDVDQIELTDRHTLPLVLPPEEVLDPNFYLWDGWPVRQWDGTVAKIGDYLVYISLSAPREGESTPSGEPFYQVAKWRYWINDGDGWQYGGEVFPEDAPGAPLGERQWAGSARLDPETGQVTFFYTAVGKVPEELDRSYPQTLPEGHPAHNRPPVLQSMVSTTATVEADEDGVHFSEFTPHDVILEPDGEIYQTFDQFKPEDVIYGFRDPWAFEDPESGERFLLFTANATFIDSPHNGVVGAARQLEDGSWELLPPILASAGVNAQLERPHLVWQDGRTYLFFTTHQFVFADEKAGPEGLYGFVTDSESFRGHYVPLNGSGLVAGNPSESPFQTYSYLVLPGGSVFGYINKVGLPETDRGSFVGAPTPMFQITMDGTEAFVSGALTPLGRDAFSQGVGPHEAQEAGV